MSAHNCHRCTLKFPTEDSSDCNLFIQLGQPSFFISATTKANVTFFSNSGLS